MNSQTSTLLASLVQMARELARRKWFVAGWSIGAGVAMAVVVLLMPSRYTSNATLIAPAGTTGGGISAIKGLSGIGDLLGMSLPGGDDPQKLLGTLLSSRALARTQAARFRLDTVWGLKENLRMEDLERAWGENFTSTFDEEDALRISFEDEDPARARDVLLAVVAWTDSAFRGINQEQARRNLSFFDERLRERKRLLDQSEDSLVAFQGRTGSFLPTEQIKQSVIEAARIESQIQQTGIEADLERKINGGTSSSAARLDALKQELESSLSRFTTKPQGRKGGTVMKKFGAALDDQLVFERLSRDVLIHSTVFAFLNQQREQQALELSRNTPLLVAVDPPSLPSKRSFPKRRTYVQAAVMFALLASSLWCLLSWWIRESTDDPAAAALRDLAKDLRRWR